MESYVWQLSHALINLQVPVIVFCEEVLQSHSPKIQVIRVKKALSRPRWLALYRFGLRATKMFSNLLIERPLAKFIVHSHERCGFHQVTTFHGPPFAQIREKPFWQKLSIRVLAHLWLERREVLASSVRFVIPNSELISRSLIHYYPAISSRLTKAITPGVPRSPKRGAKKVDPTGGVVGFIGKEWKRKGLEFFLLIIAELTKTRPDIEVIILGPKESEVKRLAANYSFKVRALGWRPARFVFSEIDLLIHPASSEPYGMVVAEAIAAGVPVLVSDQCGAASDVMPSCGTVLSLLESPKQWSLWADKWLGTNSIPSTHLRDWREVARDYQKIYLGLED
jgi:UDP-glucose:(heptosyl)LPS alpha-1,3-glucosyltransferase